MQKYVCEPCGYVYDPELGDPDNGVEPGTAFEDLPEDWVCQSADQEKKNLFLKKHKLNLKMKQKQVLSEPVFLW